MISDQSSERAASPPSGRHTHILASTGLLSRPWAPAFAGALVRPSVRDAHRVSRRLGRPGGHSEGQNTRSHPELGRENPQRRWYCASRRGRVGRRQARQDRRLREPNGRATSGDASVAPSGTQFRPMPPPTPHPPTPGPSNPNTPIRTPSPQSPTPSPRGGAAR